jgi:DNA-binding response OmpR family regulator
VAEHQGDPAIAVFSANPDIREMLDHILTARGFVVSTLATAAVVNGGVNLTTFWRSRGPRVVLWHLEPPHDENWNTVRMLRSNGALTDCALVICSTSPELVGRVVAGDLNVYRVVGMPFDFETLVTTLRQAQVIGDWIAARDWRQRRSRRSTPGFV